VDLTRISPDITTVVFVLAVYEGTHINYNSLIITCNVICFFFEQLNNVE
jgi:hypothetical protein